MLVDGVPNGPQHEHAEHVYWCFTSSLLDEVLLHVVTVDFGPAEDNGLVHFVLLDGSHGVLSLQDLYCL